MYFRFGQPWVWHSPGPKLDSILKDVGDLTQALYADSDLDSEFLQFKLT